MSQGAASGGAHHGGPYAVYVAALHHFFTSAKHD